jgi:hypothetical protein
MRPYYRRAWTSRGELDPARDNRSLVREILSLRTEQTKMHGYKNYAEYATADTMVGDTIVPTDCVPGHCVLCIVHGVFLYIVYTVYTLFIVYSV